MANYNQLQAERFWNQQYADEVHNVGGDCLNPKCDYVFTPEDEKTIRDFSGWFTCPNCGWTYNYLNEEKERKTRAGITMDQMGSIGEEIVDRLGTIPGLGALVQSYSHLKSNPIDAVFGDYGVEVKTIHSEAQQRFKMGGEYIYIPELGKAVRPKESKEYYCQQNGLRPALVGVRLNFYTDQADIFVREGMTDTWIGNKAMQHVGTVDFSDLNPFKHPWEVPPANELPQDDEDSDIPF